MSRKMFFLSVFSLFCCLVSCSFLLSNQSKEDDKDNSIVCSFNGNVAIKKNKCFLRLSVANHGHDVIQLKTMKNGVFSPLQIVADDVVIAEEDFEIKNNNELHGLIVKPTTSESIEIEFRILDFKSLVNKDLHLRFTLGFGDDFKMYNVNLIMDNNVDEGVRFLNFEFEE